MSTSPSWVTPPPQGRTALYRLYDGQGRLLYLGITHDTKQRWARHAHDQNWWHLVARKDVTWFDTRDEALAAEKRATSSEHPLYDRSSRFGGSWWKLPCPEYDDTEDLRKVTDALRRDIKAGIYPQNAWLAAHRIAPRHGISRSTAASALWDLVSEGLLRANRPGFRVQ